MSLSSLIEGDIYGHATYIEKTNKQKTKKNRVGKVRRTNLVPRAFPLKDGWGGKSPGDEVEGAHQPKAQTAGAYTGFRSMKYAYGVLLLPPWTRC